MLRICISHLLISLPALLSAAWAHAECNGESWAPASRYRIKSGEVQDKQTGLHWKRCPEGMSWNGDTCAGKLEEMTWDYAIERYPARGNLWRLPSKDELASLRTGFNNLKQGCWWPAINTRVFPGGQDIFFWSSSPGMGDPNYALGVTFNDGVIYRYPRGNYCAVRLVRAGR